MIIRSPGSAGLTKGTIMGKGIRNLIAAICMGGALCSPALGSILVDHPPHPFGGPDSDTSFYLFPGFMYSQRLADDFVLSSTEQVVSLNWWGFYEEDNPPMSETMRVRIYGARGDGLPDESGLVAETTVQNPMRAATGRRIQTGILPREYRYEAALSTPASLDANTTYWLEVVQIGDLTTRFRWESSVADLNGHAFVNPGVGDWTLAGNGADLAFQLIVPEPGSLLPASFGLVVVMKSARRKKA